MIQIKIGEKTLIVEDGSNVEVSGDEIRVKPGAPQPVYVPFVSPWPQPYWNPIYPQPNYTGPQTVDPFRHWPDRTITCGTGSSTGYSGPTITSVP
jgi:hypothetical protein